MNNLIELDKPLREAYEESDKHSDCQFFDLPQQAQDEAIRIYKEFSNRNVITRELDRSMVFRGAFEERLKHKDIDVYDAEFYLQAVDTCNRYFNFIENA